MSTSAHIFGWIFGRKQQEHRESGWQRARDTGEIAIVHQRPQPIYDPQPAPQPTGAMMRQWRSEHAPAPRAQDTEGIRRLSRPTGLDPRDWSEVPTAKKLPGLDWLEKQLPQGALPVRRPVTDRPISGHLPDAFRTESRALTDHAPVERYYHDGPLATKPPQDLGFADLPTWLAPSTIEARISAALPPLPADDAGWLNSEPLRLTPLPEQAIAATDRVATSNAFALSDEECAPDLDAQEDATMAQEDRALYQLRLLARSREEKAG